MFPFKNMSISENLEKSYNYSLDQVLQHVPLQKHEHVEVFIRQGAPLGPDDVLAKGEQALHRGAARHRRVVPQKEVNEDHKTASLS